MVASPVDLASGRPFGRSDAVPAVNAIDRYLTDKITPPPEPTANPSAAALLAEAQSDRRFGNVVEHLLKTGCRRGLQKAPVLPGQFCKSVLLVPLVPRPVASRRNRAGMH
jgi:hypothetical protein